METLYVEFEVEFTSIWLFSRNVNSSQLSSFLKNLSSKCDSAINYGVQ